MHGRLALGYALSDYDPTRSRRIRVLSPFIDEGGTARQYTQCTEASFSQVATLIVSRHTRTTGRRSADWR